MSSSCRWQLYHKMREKLHLMHCKYERGKQSLSKRREEKRGERERETERDKERELERERKRSAKLAGSPIKNGHSLLRTN